MILFFHCLCLFARYIVSNISKSLSKYKINVQNNGENIWVTSSEIRKEYEKLPVYKDGTLLFSPPVYVQRYETVALILEDLVSQGKVHKVADFGCAELGFFIYMKNMDGIYEILEIDIDEQVLKKYSYKAAPLTSDYLMNKSKKPLDVYVLQGDVSEYDDHLRGTDIVIGIELIEHLVEESLKKLIVNIFHRIKPKIVLFTTPNAEFNSLFPNFTDLRHNDHKFEWTRKEFYTWTQEIINQYPEYSVRFFGVGAGPIGTENLGCCTQMALFEKFDDSFSTGTINKTFEEVNNYKLIEHYSYPFQQDTRSKEEKIICEIKYQMAYLYKMSDYYNYDSSECEIPLEVLMAYVPDLCNDIVELRKILENGGMRVKEINNSWYLLFTDTDFYSDHGSFFEDETSSDCSQVMENNFDEESYNCDEFLEAEDSVNYVSARSIEPNKLTEPRKTDIFSVNNNWETT